MGSDRSRGGEEALEKSTQLRRLQFLTVFFGVLAIAPISAGALLIHSSGFVPNTTNFVTTAVPTFSLTILFVYYFRIVLRNADSCRSQILQLDLRKALCQFIQNYASYAKSMKKDDATLLDKFESIIFSGIVASGEKLPSTFDGVDQIATLVKAVRAK